VGVKNLQFEMHLIYFITYERMELHFIFGFDRKLPSLTSVTMFLRIKFFEGILVAHKCMAHTGSSLLISQWIARIMYNI